MSTHIGRPPPNGTYCDRCGADVNTVTHTNAGLLCDNCVRPPPLRIALTEERVRQIVREEIDLAGPFVKAVVREYGG